MKTVIFNLIFFILFLFNFQLNAEAVQDFSNCTASGCHLSQTKYSVLHSPVEDGCTDCHQTDALEHPIKNEKEFSLTSKMPELCFECHDQNNQMKNIHSPVEEGDCLSCHNPHSTENEFLLVKESGETCQDCHDIHETEDTMHGPVAANMCSACHDPHQSELPGLLAREGVDLCLFCHTEKKDQQAKPSVHDPFIDGCLECHSPHSSPYKYMVNKDVPGLCFDCHDAVKVQVGQESEVHGPFQKGGKCYKCHDAHVSDHKSLLIDKEQNLCFTCHNKKIKKGDKTIKDIEKRVAKAKYVHGPITDDGCSACHAAHTPDNYFLLSAAFPKGSYGKGSKESFAHCFDCHDAKLMESKETTTVTGFRDGKINLHFVHVNREKARNCNTCHDIHGSKYPHLVASKIPFGKWEMPMKFKKTTDGGSCLTGCHKELDYDRKAMAKN